MELKTASETKNAPDAPAVSGCLAQLACSAPEDDNQDARLRVHLDAGDYFSLLATIFGFVEDTCVEHERKGYGTAPMTSDVFQKLRGDLIYLQHHYHISKNDASAQDTPLEKVAVCNHTLRQQV
ncbi:MAG: hypothetical protein ACYCPH_03165 [Minisyncoccota bacterium]